MDPVLYLPLLTTAMTVWFVPQLYRRWRQRQPAPHLWWWMFGVAMYGVGTFTESATTLFGWHPVTFRAWYVSGALLGGMPLAQGTAYLLLSRRTANRLTAMLFALVIPTALLVAIAPLDASLAEPHRLSGAVLGWQQLRLVSPFVNIYAFIMLVGGAIWSAWAFRREVDSRNKVVGNILIAVGGILPGIGGMYTRFGHVEVLYVTELAGLLLIYAGFRLNIRPRPGPPGATVGSVPSDHMPG